MYSMTGYGRCDLERDGRAITLEMKSVNHRFLDLSFRMPRTFAYLEDALRALIGRELSRGHVDVFINYRNLQQGCQDRLGGRGALAGVHAGPWKRWRAFPACPAAQRPAACQVAGRAERGRAGGGPGRAQVPHPGGCAGPPGAAEGPCARRKASAWGRTSPCTSRRCAPSFKAFPSARPWWCRSTGSA